LLVDGSTQRLKSLASHVASNGSKKSRRRKRLCISGAAVVYKEPTNRWVEKGYHLPHLKWSNMAELIAILKVLKVGFEYFKDLAADISTETKDIQRELKVFSDCQSSFQVIGSWIARV
jgi:hypothetical protein